MIRFTNSTGDGRAIIWRRLLTAGLICLLGVDTFSLPDDDRAHSVELRELFGRRHVSSLLGSSFRERLNQILQSHVGRLHRASGDWLDQDQEQQLFEGDHPNRSVSDADEHNKFDPPSDLFGGSHQLWGGVEFQGMSWSHHHLNAQLETVTLSSFWLQQRMDHMQSMLEACMEMQIELQRSVRQELSATLNRPTFPTDASMESQWDHVRKGICCMCRDNKLMSCFTVTIVAFHHDITIIIAATINASKSLQPATRRASTSATPTVHVSRPLLPRASAVLSHAQRRIDFSPSITRSNPTSVPVDFLRPQVLTLSFSENLVAVSSRCSVNRRLYPPLTIVAFHHEITIIIAATINASKSLQPATRRASTSATPTVHVSRPLLPRASAVLSHAQRRSDFSPSIMRSNPTIVPVNFFCVPEFRLFRSPSTWSLSLLGSR
ncbi:Ring/U-Box superfamily protein [Striga hermonthica]|uniref:Ring/U-Box superfamily protein n=1 Tax=Striga hermonthica TaxID=68872 RepID=A0A9N7NQZ7_STRHE|nr:Ring/U-Box superfamily protein [Striga hermonthica]